MSRESVRVLILEDNPAECRLVEEMLMSVDRPLFSVESVTSLEAGKQALEKNAYDVLILDLGLGQSQGIETLKSIRSLAPHIPIVVLTLLDDEKVGVQAMQEGAQDYLIKAQVNGPFLSRALRYAIERAKTQDDLRRASFEWDRTFNAINDSIMLIDKDYRITRVNKATFALFDLKREEIVGKRCFEVTHRMDKPWPDCPFGQTLSDLKPHVTELVNPEAQTCYLVSSSPIFDPSGNFLGIVHVTRDISELKKTERYLERRVRDLEIFRKAAVDRELVMVRLKRRLKDMEERVKRVEGIL